MPPPNRKRALELIAAGCLPATALAFAAREKTPGSAKTASSETGVPPGSGPPPHATPGRPIATEDPLNRQEQEDRNESHGSGH